MLLNIYSPLIIFTTIVLISFIIPKLIPSAFNIGLDYEQVDINLRILANYSLYGLKVTFHSILKYFILCVPYSYCWITYQFFI